MNRRKFLSSTAIQTGAAVAALSARRLGMAGLVSPVSAEAAEAPTTLKPMAVGLLIQPANGAEAAISRVKEMGFTNCFFSLDGYLGKYTPVLAQQLKDLLDKYELVATTAEVVGPGRLVWDFLDGPSTIGMVPRETRTARMDALKQTSDFAKRIGIPRVQTHCGFIPENPRDPLYDEAVLAIREVTQHCAENGQEFLMETGQETPTTMSRAIHDVGQPNLGGCGRYHRAACKKRPRERRKVADRPDEAGRRGADWQRPCGLHKGFHEAAQAGIHQRHHHRARDVRSAADRGCKAGEGLPRKHHRAHSERAGIGNSEQTVR
jgi:hypothetical protein